MRGGKREGAGRKVGSVSRLTHTARELAGQYSEEAFNVLVSIMRDEETDPKARLIAAKEILDRAYGKPAQYQEVEQRVDFEENEGGLTHSTAEMIRREILGIYPSSGQSLLS